MLLNTEKQSNQVRDQTAKNLLRTVPILFGCAPCQVCCPPSSIARRHDAVKKIDSSYHGFK